MLNIELFYQKKYEKINRKISEKIKKKDNYRKIKVKTKKILKIVPDILKNSDILYAALSNKINNCKMKEVI